MAYKVAGIDVHKKVLMVVVRDVSDPDSESQRRRFGTTTSELRELSAWLRKQGVQEAVMESTAQYWRPIWYELEPYMKLQLAQAFSNRAPRGRKHDFRDAERLVRRLAAGELILSFVPEPEQRTWRTMTRMKVQLTEDKSRLHSQLECLLEEMRIKLSSVITDLLGVSGYRILRALAGGETDPEKLAALGDERLRCTEKQLVDALSGSPQPVHLQLLALYLDRHQTLVEQIAKLDSMIAEALKPHQEAVVRLALVPGLGVDSAQQIIAEVGADAGTFPSPGHLSAWVGTCPGRDETAEENHSSRSAKGNKYLRRILNQAAHAAVKKKGSHFQAVFRRLLPRLGYNSTIWAVAHRLCRLVWKILHEGISYVEQGSEPDARTKHRHARNLIRTLRKLGYHVELKPITPPPRPCQAAEAR
jgi:transposase